MGPAVIGEGLLSELARSAVAAAAAPAVAAAAAAQAAAKYIPQSCMPLPGGANPPACLHAALACSHACCMQRLIAHMRAHTQPLLACTLPAFLHTTSTSPAHARLPSMPSLRQVAKLLGCEMTLSPTMTGLTFVAFGEHCVCPTFFLHFSS